MIAIDTNVLVRILVKDDLTQSKKALTCIVENAPVFLTKLVLCETTWVLQSCYDFDKTKLINFLELLLRTTHFIIQDKQVIWSALQEFQSTKADFSDCLIGAISEEYGNEYVATFDKKASQSSFFALIT